MIQNSHAQYSEEWWEARRGLPTASQFSRIVKGDGSESTQRTAYLYECAAVRITGIYKPTFTSAAMQEGTDREELSRWIYAMETDSIVDEVGFCMSDCGRWGASPDGLVGSDGVLELKNPEAHTHVGYLLSGKLPSAYYQQVMGELLVTGRLWADFCSYSPKLPLFVLRVYRDDLFLDKLEKALIEFSEELDEVCATILKEA